MSGRILYRAIATHLIVAVAPAIALGALLVVLFPGVSLS